MVQRIPLERRAAWVLGVPTAAVFLAAVAMQAYLRLVRHDDTLLATFGLDGEHNVPAFWNTVLLLSVAGAATLLGVLTPRGVRPSPRVWFATAAVMAYLALDEALSIHERLGRPVRTIGEQLGVHIPTYAWVIPGALLAGVALLVAARWLSDVPRDVRVALGVAAGVYLAGALVVETVDGALFALGRHSLYAAGTAVEELLEMTGCVLATCALVRMVDVDPQTRGMSLRRAPEPVDAVVHPPRRSDVAA